MKDKFIEIGCCELCGRETSSLAAYSVGKICGACARIVACIDICPMCGELVNRLNSVDVEDGMRTKYIHHECYFKKG